MMWFKGNVITYARFQTYVEDVARALAGLGVKKGDRVALLMPNIPQMIICQVAVWKAGGVAVPVNPLFSESELVHTLKDCGAEMAVVMTPFYGQIKNIQSKTRVKTVIATG
ncbi:MAG TPA: AMP-dependent synthetase, partial [Syntrophus sp. (in: bacteria)]|nr:AMP-dependent synthetase [Syntrophus sp. (in: bacteria)]